tara:strand:+ start:280 stop:390 length:111 start_codon:yes stop_codon:yes gene_type:complete
MTTAVAWTIVIFGVINGIILAIVGDGKIHRTDDLIK